MRRLPARLAQVLVLAAALGAGGCASSPPADARAFAVSPNGDDDGPGTAARPWRTIGRAAAAATPGSVVDVRGGVYRERVAVAVSGEPGRPIVFRAHPGERVVVDGTGLPAADGLVGLITVAGRHDLVFEGLELRNHRSDREGFVPAGVLVTGAAARVALRRLDVHDIATSDGDAHGVAFYGTSATPMRDVRLVASRVHRLRLGTSEAVVVNGNVQGWVVARNHVFRTDNIGIDAIGFEGTAPRDDRARDGRIDDNLVEDVDTAANPAYDEPGGGNCRCAGGIYVDGGTRVSIERNVVARANIGIELASESAAGSTTDVLVRDNVVRASTASGLALGGYDRRRGPTARVRVVRNSFLGNDTLGERQGELQLQYRVTDSEIAANVFAATARGTMMTNPYRENAGNAVDANVWWAPAEAAARATWEWRAETSTGFAAYRAATGLDPRGAFAAPRLTSAGLALRGFAAGARLGRRP